MISSRFVPSCLSPRLAMNSYPRLIGRVLSICSVAGVLWWTYGGRSPIVLAQIRPDNFLGNSPSTVRTDNSTGQRLIEGGATRGTTLFHSFKAFNIEPDGNAYFANPDTIDLIVSRVTGRRASNLLGTLGILGNADLFFINPNGITFGPNSTLDLNGAFVASTADSLAFGDEFNFSASSPTSPPLLTITVPTGLEFQTPQPINYESEGAFDSLGLGVQPGQTLALIGGALNFQGANLSATAGRIELASIAGPGLVTVTQTAPSWAFSLNEIAQFADFTSNRGFISTTIEDDSVLGSITPQENSIVIHAADITTASTIIQSNTFTDTSAGNIVVNAQTLTLSDGSVISSRAVTVSPDDIRGRAGNVLINVSESVELSGGNDFGDFISPVGISSDVTGEFTFGGFTSGAVSGSGGNVIVNTKRLSIRNGATIQVRTNTIGDSGNVVINATESVEVSGVFLGETAFLPSLISSGNFGGTGNGGTLEINTGRLRLQDGGNILSNSTGVGSGGLIDINARVVEVVGSSPIPNNPDRTELLSTITASARDVGDAGQIVIDAEQVRIKAGGQITTETLPESRGNGNLLTVNGANTIFIEGVSAIDQTPSGLFSSTQGEGEAGFLRVITDELTITEGGLISAATLTERIDPSNEDRITRRITPANVTESLPLSGGLELQVNRLLLDNGTLSVETFAQGGSGANIDISGLEVLVLANDSLLSAEAFNSANGGNINLNASDGFVIAPVDTNSDILARANQGNGGEIEIVARTIFGLEERLAISGNGTNDIDASSRVGASGTVSLNQLDVNPVPEAAELSERPNSPEISQACNPSQQVSSLVLTGRGGIPPKPQNTVPGLLWSPSEGEAVAIAPSHPQTPPPTSSDSLAATRDPRPILEAQGWQRNETGQLRLTALPHTPTLHVPDPVPHCTLHS